MKRGVAAAYGEVSKGNSTDYILCDRELNAEFVASCKKRGLPGSAFVWNRLLLRIRKAGKLSKGGRSRKRLTSQSMDAYSFASEIAMQLVGVNYGMTLDDVLCTPNAAAELDEIAGEFAPGHSSFEYRWAALTIRKRAIKAKKLAKRDFQDWLQKTLPRSIPLSRCRSDKFDCAGVYVLANRSQAIYVGETYSLRSRIEQVLSAASWTAFEPRSVKFIPMEEPRLRHGLQSILIHRTNPLLNSGLLRPELYESAVGK